ncbi:hypothetical protein ATM17_20290 [Sphingopyxis macrogoltabida]|uniref:Uncharacterized protein n=1 Tax=Sphingopyxis macrogoltabida TaxID=33050 RepID=A0AAC9AWR3_SPHMC|nr:hypothetical protein LH19_19740 [Sphingopyxis macrogoltabida]AMU91357.1 hypothetical protein ATM17_20290 [Sphingopyxis macrogoltabida]
MIAATPFLWLIVRDTVMLLRANDGEKKEEAQWILAERLAQTIGYSDIRTDAQAPMISSRAHEPNCFVVDASAFRPSDTPPAQSPEGSQRWVEFDKIFAKHEMLAERAASQISQHQLLSRNFSTSELMLFNACLSATPFAGWCEARISDRLRDKYYKSYREVMVSRGLMLRRAKESGRSCFTMPRVIKP